MIFLILDWSLLNDVVTYCLSYFLPQVTHVVMDELHERDKAALRRVLVRSATSEPNGAAMGHGRHGPRLAGDWRDFDIFISSGAQSFAMSRARRTGGERDFQRFLTALSIAFLDLVFSLKFEPWDCAQLLNQAFNLFAEHLRTWRISFSSLGA